MTPPITAAERAWLSRLTQDTAVAVEIERDQFDAMRAAYLQAQKPDLGYRTGQRLGFTDWPLGYRP